MYVTFTMCSTHYLISCQPLLDMFAFHKRINVKLVRHVHFSQDASQAAMQYVAQAIIGKHADIPGLIEGCRTRETISAMVPQATVPSSEFDFELADDNEGVLHS